MAMLVLGRRGNDREQNGAAGHHSVPIVMVQVIDQTGRYRQKVGCVHE